MCAGYEHVFVCTGGANGWGFDQQVLPYDAFGPQDPPPEPRPSRGGSVNIDQAAAELRRLGIL